MKTENKIIKIFIEDSESKTIREIAKKIKSDYRITYFAAQKLIQRKILLAKSVGKSTLCSLNDSYYGVEINRVETERKEEILKNKNIKQLYNEVMIKIDSSFFIFLLFGSYAKGKQTKSSDIDLMFISNNKKFEERVENILSLLPLKTHILVFTEEEFKKMKDAKKPNVVQEAIKSNIVMYGVENFYRLMNI